MKEGFLFLFCFVQILIIHTHPVTIDDVAGTYNPNLVAAWKNILNTPCNGDVDTMCSLIDVAAPYSEAIATEAIKNAGKIENESVAESLVVNDAEPVSNPADVITVVPDEQNQVDNANPLEEGETVDQGVITTNLDQTPLDKIEVVNTEIPTNPAVDQDLTTLNLDQTPSDKDEAVNTEVPANPAVDQDLMTSNLDQTPSDIDEVVNTEIPANTPENFAVTEIVNPAEYTYSSLDYENKEATEITDSLIIEQPMTEELPITDGIDIPQDPRVNDMEVVDVTHIEEQSDTIDSNDNQDHSDVLSTSDTNEPISQSNDEEKTAPINEVMTENNQASSENIPSIENAVDDSEHIDPTITP